MDCYSPSIYDVYFEDNNIDNDTINNESDNVINGILIN